MKKYCFITILITFIAFSTIAGYNDGWKYEREISGGTVISGTMRSAGDSDDPLSSNVICTIYKTWSDTMPSNTHDGMVHHWTAIGNVMNYESDETYGGSWSIEAKVHDPGREVGDDYEGAFGKTYAQNRSIENYRIFLLLFPNGLVYSIDTPTARAVINGGFASKDERNVAASIIPF